MKDMFKMYKAIFSTLIVWAAALFLVSGVLKLWDIVFNAGLSMEMIGAYSAIASICAVLAKIWIDIDKLING